MTSFKTLITVFVSYTLFILSLTSCKNFSFKTTDHDYTLQGLFDRHHFLRLKQVDESATRFRFEVCPRDGVSYTDKPSSTSTRPHHAYLANYCVSALQRDSGEDVIFTLNTVDITNLTQAEKKTVTSFQDSWQKYQEQIKQKTGFNPSSLGMITGGSIALGHAGIFGIKAGGYSMKSGQYYKQFGVRNVEEATKELNNTIRELKKLGWDVAKNMELTAQEVAFLKANTMNKFSAKFTQFHLNALSQGGVSDLGTNQQVLESIKNYVSSDNSVLMRDLINEQFYDRFVEYFQLKYSNSGLGVFGNNTFVKFQLKYDLGRNRNDNIIDILGMTCDGGDGCLEFSTKTQSFLDDFDRFILDQGRVNKYMDGHVLAKLSRMENLLSAIAVKDPARLKSFVAYAKKFVRRQTVIVASGSVATLALLGLEGGLILDNLSHSLATITGSANTTPQLKPVTMTKQLNVVLMSPKEINALWDRGGVHENTKAITPILETFVLFQSALWDTSSVTSYCLPQTSHVTGTTKTTYLKVCYRATNDTDTAKFVRVSASTIPQPDQNKDAHNSVSHPTKKTTNKTETTNTQHPATQVPQASSDDDQLKSDNKPGSWPEVMPLLE
ncbi:MAG: hypothetical protein OXC40_06595 [Proteobacteria bacterium]|nr:hypothetical protein [Pseudomonadota bacterium]